MKSTEGAEIQKEDKLKFRNFLGVSSTPQQAYFKEGVELLYPDQKKPMKVAILPAYDPRSLEPTGWLPAVTGDEESDFYTTVRAAKFVGHGNRRAKVSFLSPRTFDLDADDPYEAFYDYCSRSDKWSYLTKDRRGKRLTGEVEGAVIPRTKNFLVMNVIDMSVGTRGGVFVTEVSESVGKALLYAMHKDGSRIDGIAFQKDDDGQLVYGDITNPEDALVLEIAWSGKGYVARPALDDKGVVMRTKVPETLLQHRQHMEEPGTFIQRPESGQEIVDRLAGLLRGYKTDEGEDEINALHEAMEFAYGHKYRINENASETNHKPKPKDPFEDAVDETAEADPEEMAASVSESVDRGVTNEKYTPVNPEVKKEKSEKKQKKAKADEVEVEVAPGEDVDPSDIAAVRAMLSGGSK